MGTPVASVTMDLERFCAASRVVIVAGKGGVGKTTVTAALATAAARTGMSVLIVEVEGKSGLAACFGEAPLTYEEAELRPGLWARTLTPDDALLESLDAHGMRRISRRLSRSGVFEAFFQLLAETSKTAHLVQMFDSTVVRAHVSAAGAKGGRKVRRSDALAAGFRARSISRRTSTACRSRFT